MSVTHKIPHPSMCDHIAHSNATKWGPCKRLHIGIRVFKRQCYDDSRAPPTALCCAACDSAHLNYTNMVKPFALSVMAYGNPLQTYDAQLQLANEHLRRQENMYEEEQTRQHATSYFACTWLMKWSFVLIQGSTNSLCLHTEDNDMTLSCKKADVYTPCILTTGQEGEEHEHRKRLILSQVHVLSCTSPHACFLI